MPTSCTTTADVEDRSPDLRGRAAQRALAGAVPMCDVIYESTLALCRALRGGEGIQISNSRHSDHVCYTLVFDA